MRFVMFYQSLDSDWNHGIAHFLRGICVELRSRGHQVAVHGPEDGWSRRNLLADHGEEPFARFRHAYPGLEPRLDGPDLDLDAALHGADVVMVHEWNDPRLVARIGAHRAGGGRYRLLFHDTHHRAMTAPADMAAYDLAAYDGVLASGDAVRSVYETAGWGDRAWTWHEAADTRVFAPIHARKHLDLVWVGNWGDGERSEELREYLIRPCRHMRLRALVHGVRYPAEALDDLAHAGIAYGGWLPNFDVPRMLAGASCTVHVPRRAYASSGIPTITMFEALACGIPLVSAPWDDRERLFRPGVDHLVARNGREMESHLRAILAERGLARELSERGRETILARHTCAHRVDELFAVLGRLGVALAAVSGAGA